MARRSRTLRFKLLLVFALLVVVAWSMLWFVAATVVERQVERAMAQAAERGTELTCTDRAVTGFPFRIELRCGAESSARTSAMDATVSSLTVAALIYRPARIITEMRGPMLVDAEGTPPVEANWELAHASFRLNLSESRMERLDAEVVGATLKVGDRLVRIKEADLNLREDPSAAGALNFAVRLNALESGFLSAPIALEAVGTVEEGAPLLRGGTDEVVRAVLFAGAPVTIDGLTLVHGDMAVRASGMVSLDEAGLISGNLTLAIAGEEAAARYVSAAMPPQQSKTVSSLLTQLLKNTPATTEVAGLPAKEVALRFDAGAVRVGAFPLPLPVKIPPIRPTLH